MWAPLQAWCHEYLLEPLVCRWWVELCRDTCGRHNFGQLPVDQWYSCNCRWLTVCTASPRWSCWQKHCGRQYRGVCQISWGHQGQCWRPGVYFMLTRSHFRSMPAIHAVRWCLWWSLGHQQHRGAPHHTSVELTWKRFQHLNEEQWAG